MSLLLILLDDIKWVVIICCILLYENSCITNNMSLYCLTDLYVLGLKFVIFNIRKTIQCGNVIFYNLLYKCEPTCTINVQTTPLDN